LTAVNTGALTRAGRVEIPRDVIGPPPSTGERLPVEGNHSQSTLFRTQPGLEVLLPSREDLRKEGFKGF